MKSLAALALAGDRERTGSRCDPPAKGEQSHASGEETCRVPGEPETVRDRGGAEKLGQESSAHDDATECVTGHRRRATGERAHTSVALAALGKPRGRSSARKVRDET